MLKKLLFAACAVFFLACSNEQEQTQTKSQSLRVFATSAHITPLVELLYPQGIIGLNYKPYPEDLEFMPENAANLPVLGGFNNVNFEQLVALKPDLIIFPKSTDKEFIKPYESLGIRTLQIDGLLENLEQSLSILGEALGVQERAARLLAFHKRTQSLLDGLRSKVQKKPKIYLAYGFEGLRTHCSRENEKDLVFILGAENVVKCEKFATESNVLSVNFELIISLNPETIFVREIGLYKELMSAPSEHWQRVSAVRDKKIYYAPSTPSNWLTSPPSAMRIIGYPWAFAKLHPDLLSEAEAKKIAQEFFAEFLRPLSDEAYRRLEAKD